MAACAMERGQRGVSRVLAKLNNSIESGNYYEAHQMYRTLYFRYTCQQKYDECLDLLYSGALKLVSKQQETSAADLGLLIVETLEKRGCKNDAELWIDRLGKIISRISAFIVERESLIGRALKWSGDTCGSNLGHPNLHKLIGQVYWHEGNTEQARNHFLLCRDSNLCGRTLIKIAISKGYKNEIDLFIAQAVLQQLCLKDRQTARDTFRVYITNHPQIKTKKAPFKQPLLNFIEFLLQLIDEGNLESFQSLCDLYKSSLNRDPCYGKYLTNIGVLFFGATPSTSTGGGIIGGMFGDMFTRLFQDLDGDDESEQQQDARNHNAVTTASQTSELD